MILLIYPNWIHWALLFMKVRNSGNQKAFKESDVTPFSTHFFSFITIIILFSYPLNILFPTIPFFFQPFFLNLFLLFLINFTHNKKKEEEVIFVSSFHPLIFPFCFSKKSSHQVIRSKILWLWNYNEVWSSFSIFPLNYCKFFSPCLSPPPYKPSYILYIL